MKLRPWKIIKKQKRIILVLADDSFYFSPGQSENLQSALLKLYKATHLPVKHVLMRVSAVVMSSCTLMLISLDGKGHQGRESTFSPTTWRGRPKLDLRVSTLRLKPRLTLSVCSGSTIFLPEINSVIRKA